MHYVYYGKECWVRLLLLVLKEEAQVFVKLILCFNLFLAVDYSYKHCSKGTQSSLQRVYESINQGQC